MMKWESATNHQLMTIAKHDKDCPSSLLEGLAVELIKRKLLDNLIFYAGKQAFTNLNYTLSNVLKISHKELFQIGYIEIVKITDKFKPGMRTFTSYLCMGLIACFKKLVRDAEAEKRIANIDTEQVDSLEPKMQDKLFRSPVNVEQYVINKIMIEDSWNVLREVEKKAIILDQIGYSQYEIAERLGFKKNYGITLIKRAYEKLRKAMVA